MKHATSRFLFSYWDGLRGERAAPERRDIEPGRIRQVIADTFILALQPDGSSEFTLAGTRVSALFGRELRGSSFENLWPGVLHAEARGLVDLVASDTVGLVSGLRGTTELGASTCLELILLPLRHDGATDARLLGALSPTSVPSWAGLMPITRLEITSTRVIRADGRSRIATAPRRVEPTERRRRFVVLEGGLSG